MSRVCLQALLWELLRCCDAVCDAVPCSDPFVLYHDAMRHDKLCCVVLQWAVLQVLPAMPLNQDSSACVGRGHTLAASLLQCSAWRQPYSSSGRHSVTSGSSSSPWTRCRRRSSSCRGWGWKGARGPLLAFSSSRRLSCDNSCALAAVIRQQQTFLSDYLLRRCVHIATR